MPGPLPRVLVLGGAGALGRAVCRALAARARAHAVSCDVSASPAAASSLTVSRAAAASPAALAGALRAALAGAPPLAGIVVCAGAWEGGSAAGADFLGALARMAGANAAPAAAAAALGAGGALAPGGLLVLTGAAAALDARAPPPGMLAYALAKGATHALGRALGAPGGGLPPRARAVVVAPHTLDTEANRGAMPGADASAWTRPEAVAEKIAQWVDAALAGDEAALPASGAVMEVVTRGGRDEWFVR